MGLSQAQGTRRIPVESGDAAEGGAVALRDVIECAPAAYLCADRTGAVVDCNRAAEHLLGRSREDLLGRDAEELLPPGPGTAVWRTGRGAAQLVHHWAPVADAPAPAPAVDDRVDALTGLPSRERFLAHLQEALAPTTAHDETLAVLIVDLDGFGDINDGLGHAVGDSVLREAARRLRGAVRRMDVVARFGNDEFALILRGLGGPDDAMSLAADVRHALRSAFDVDGIVVHVSGSIGIAVARSDGSAPEPHVANANAALARARSMRSGWALHQDGQEGSSLHRVGLAADLRVAIEREELEVAYQPVVETRSGKVVGLEALARWNHAERGFVPPDQFIALAEQLDLITPLTRIILRKALAECASWHAAGHEVRVAVNLSLQVLSSTDFRAEVAQALETAGVSPEHLILEITESALATDVEHMREALLALRALGVHLVIDDFGTGYSAMSYLKILPLAELKIDRSFVQTIAEDGRDLSIVRSLVRLAHSLDLRVVAEGVESPAALELLDDLHCDLVQGYGIARPMPRSDVLPWLAEAAARLPASPEGPVAPRAGREVRDLLVVEDSDTVRRLLVLRAEAAGWRVHQAATAEDAIAGVAGLVPDVVVLDHNLPGMSGVHAIPHLREAGVDGPILLFTRFLSEVMPEMRVPLDVWPVSKANPDGVLELLAAYRASTR